MGVRVRLMASSGASCGGGAGAHGDKPPRALGGGGQRLWRGCGVWMEVKETMDKGTGWAVDGAQKKKSTSVLWARSKKWMNGPSKTGPCFKNANRMDFFKPLGTVVASVYNK